MERLMLFDDDFVDVVWGLKFVEFLGVVVLFYGLEGSIWLYYVNDMMVMLLVNGW